MNACHETVLVVLVVCVFPRVALTRKTIRFGVRIFVVILEIMQTPGQPAAAQQTPTCTPPESPPKQYERQVV